MKAMKQLLIVIGLMSMLSLNAQMFVEKYVDNTSFVNVVADESCFTSCPGVFVAGDCRTKKVRQVVTAIADGSVAGFNCCQYLDTL